MNPVLIPSDGGKQVNILGIPMLIRLHGRDTGGVVSAVESHDVPGGGPLPHIHHREDETNPFHPLASLPTAVLKLDS